MVAGRVTVYSRDEPRADSYRYDPLVGEGNVCHFPPQISSKARMPTVPRTLIITLLALISASLAHAAEIHQWRDKDGHVSFGDRPPGEVASTLVKVKPNVYTTPSIEGLAKVLQQPEQVVMYSASWCGYCKKARAYFQSHAIAFNEYDVETSAKGQQDYARLGAHGVPVVLVGRQRMNGFSEGAFEKMYQSK